MNPIDDLDRTLREAGEDWRSTLPSAPSLDPSNFAKTARRVPGARLAAAAMSLGILGAAALLIVASLPQETDRNGSAARPSATDPGSSITPTAVVSSPDTTPQHDCYQTYRTVEPLAPTIENWARLTHVIAVGTFQGFGAAFWDSPDGSRPTRDQLDAGDARLLTPVSLATSGAIRGQRSVAERGVVWGGKLGCDEMATDHAVALTEGQRYVFFMAEVLNARGESSDNPLIVDAWPIGPNDEVVTPVEGRRSLAVLKEDIARGGPASTPARPPASPGEPPDDVRP